MTSFVQIKTPCIGRCSTIYGDVVCRGCKRFYQEIIDWNRCSVEERHSVIMRLDSLLTPLVMKYFEIFDQSLLKEQLENKKVRFLSEQSPYCWAYNLLIRGAAHIKQLENYGLRRREVSEEIRGFSLVDLRDAIDKEFFAASEIFLQQYNKENGMVD